MPKAMRRPAILIPTMTTAGIEHDLFTVHRLRQTANG